MSLCNYERKSFNLRKCKDNKVISLILYCGVFTAAAVPVPGSSTARSEESVG